MEFFNKSTSQGDVPTVILSGGEALVIPTPFTKWNELRVLACFSLTTDDEVNANIDNQGDIGSSSNRYNFNANWLYGITQYKNFDFFNKQNNVFYGYASFLQRIRYDETWGDMVKINSDNSYESLNYLDRVNNFWCDDDHHDNTSSYCSYIGFKYVKNDDNIDFSMYMSNNRTYTKNSFIDRLINGGYSSTSTESFSNPNNNSPSVIYIYWPYFEYRLRIHAVTAKVFS